MRYVGLAVFGRVGAYALGVAAVVGHTFPLYRKGGKGVAAAGGMQLGVGQHAKGAQVLDAHRYDCWRFVTHTRLLKRALGEVWKEGRDRLAERASETRSRPQGRHAGARLGADDRGATDSCELG